MAKKNVQIHKDPSKSYFVYKNGITIHPISEFEYKRRSGVTDYSCIARQMFYIEVRNNGKISVYPKKIKEREVDDAIWAVINSYFKKLNQINNE